MPTTLGEGQGKVNVITPSHQALLFTSLTTLAKHGQAVDNGGRVEAEDELVVGSTILVAIVVVKVGEREVAEELFLEEGVGLEGLGVVPHAQLDAVLRQGHLEAARHVQGLVGRQEEASKLLKFRLTETDKFNIQVMNCLESWMRAVSAAP